MSVKLLFLSILITTLVALECPREYVRPLGEFILESRSRRRPVGCHSLSATFEEMNLYREDGDIAEENT